MVDKNKFAEEEALGYRIEIVGRNIQVTEPMRKYAWDKLSKIERFHNHIFYVHATLEMQKLEHACIIVVKFDHFKIKVQAVSSDMYASIDRAVDKLQALTRKYKSRIQDHHRKKLSVIDMQVNVVQRPYDELSDINSEIDAVTQKLNADRMQVPKIIGNEVQKLKTLNLDEAMMKMDLSGDHFLIFRSEEDLKLKVLYLRSDGNYGLIQPE